MRCPVHPDRVAESLCTVCGTRHCASCAPPHRFLEEPVCPSCAPSVARRLTGVERAEHTERRARSPRAGLLFGGAAGFVLLALLGTQVLFPALKGTAAPEDPRAEVVSSFTQVGLALEVWRAREGSYPAELSLLVPGDLAEIPRDPYDSGGAPLRYRSSESELGAILLYSVGPDGRDDGGTRQDGVSGRGDLVYPVR